MIQHDGGKGDFVEDTLPMLGIWNTLLEGESDATWVFMQWEGVEAKLKEWSSKRSPCATTACPTPTRLACARTRTGWQRTATSRERS